MDIMQPQQKTTKSKAGTRTTIARSLLGIDEWPKALTDKVIALDGFDNAHVGAGLLLHV